MLKIYRINDRMSKINCGGKKMSILLKNGTVVDYANNIDKKLDILIEGDKIVKIGENLCKMWKYNFVKFYRNLNF